MKPDDAELMVLAVLSGHRAYGYMISKEVAARTGQATTLSASVLYPLLARLEREALVTCTWDEMKAEPSSDSPGRKRKWYEITLKGRRRLEQRASAHMGYVRMMAAFLGKHAGGEPMEERA